MWAFEHATDIPQDNDVMLDSAHSGPGMRPKVTKLRFVIATLHQSRSEKWAQFRRYTFIGPLSNLIVPLGTTISLPYVEFAPSLVPQNTFIVLGT